MSDKVLEQFPYELRLAIDGLNNESRQKILFFLKDVEKLSFSEIRNKVETSPPLLANHLNKLIDTFLVEHFYEHKIGDERYSYYKISTFGKYLIENMLETLYAKRITKAKITYFKAEFEEKTSVQSSIFNLSETKQGSDATTEIDKIVKKIVVE